MDLINLIKPKNGLLIKQLNSKVFKTLYEELSTFDSNKELLNDLEFLSLACNLCEHIVDQQKKHFKALKLDKMKLVVSVFVVIYDSMSEDDIERLKQNIQFIYDNEMIKKVSTVRVLKKGLSAWISKQF